MIGGNRPAHFESHVSEVFLMPATPATILTRLRPNRNPVCLENRMPELCPYLLTSFSARVLAVLPCPPLGQTDRNRPQIDRRPRLLAPQTVRDRTDEAYIVPPAGLLSLAASVALLSGTTTNRSGHKYVALPQGGHDGSQRNLRRKCDALLIDLVPARIYPVFWTSSRWPRGKQFVDRPHC